MKFLLGHSTALNYWRLHDRNETQRKTRATGAFTHPPNKAVLDTLPETSGPIHFIVTDKKAHRRSEGVVCHLSSNLPRNSFLMIGKGIYVSTPEACFLQMAAEYPFAKLLKIGFELCGTYSIYDDQLIRREPRMSTGSLYEYLSHATGCKGAKRAALIVKYLADNSASPMETALTALLCLPPHRGGYGLPQPLLNYPIKQEHILRYCDLCWPGSKLALEYDSDAHHASPRKLNEDSFRRIQIETTDMHVISVTKTQLFDPNSFEQLAHVVGRYLGKRIRTNQQDHPVQQMNLRKELFLVDAVRSSVGPRVANKLLDEQRIRSEYAR